MLTNNYIKIDYNYSDATTINDYGTTNKVKQTKILYGDIESDYYATGLTAKQIFRDINRWHKWVDGRSESVRKTPKERLREILQRRQTPAVIISRKSMAATSDIREIRARETLKRVLGENKFRKFLKDGFVSVQAKSGLVYQIFPSHGITNVYRDGEKTERLCVVLKGQFPPTDSLIMRYLLILNDERDFRKHAIEHKVYPSEVVPTLITETESLNDIWGRLRKVA